MLPKSFDIFCYSFTIEGEGCVGSSTSYLHFRDDVIEDTIFAWMILIAGMMLIARMIPNDSPLLAVRGRGPFREMRARRVRLI